MSAPWNYNTVSNSNLCLSQIQEKKGGMKYNCDRNKTFLGLRAKIRLDIYKVQLESQKIFDQICLPTKYTIKANLLSYNYQQQTQYFCVSSLGCKSIYRPLSNPFRSLCYNYLQNITKRFDIRINNLLYGFPYYYTFLFFIG